MKTTTSNLRIVWTISSKDLVDSIKNKHVLAVILPAIVLILIYRFIPMMNASDTYSTLRIFSVENDITLSSLEENSNYRLVSFTSLEDLQYGLTNEELPEIALVFPEGFDAGIGDGAPQSIQGYMLDYFTADEIFATKTAVESELSQVLNAPVSIQVETIPLQLESYGITILTSMALTFGIVMVGVIALPHMMLEEKDEKTLDVMLVSPARSSHIVLAKSLTGMCLTLTVFAISLVFYQQYFVHWWLIVLCGVLGAGFAISIGVGLGILVDSRQKLTLYGWLVMLPLFLPLVLVVMEDLFPQAWISVLQWFPSVAIMRLVRTAMAETIHAAYFLPQITVLIVCTAITLMFDSWLLRRMER